MLERLRSGLLYRSKDSLSKQISGLGIDLSTRTTKICIGVDEMMVRTGQVPPATIRSKDRASGMPAGLSVVLELRDSLNEGLDDVDCRRDSI